MTIAAIIVAAGRGTRAGEGPPKQWRQLGGMTVLERSVACFRRADIERIIVVLHPDDMAQGVTLFGGDVILVAGGATRISSVRNALELIDPNNISKVLIHDGARPFVDQAVIQRVIDALKAAPAAAPALPVTDALWRGDNGVVRDSADREGLFRAQTPQGFDLRAILDAHRAYDPEQNAADDVEIARASGIITQIVQGSEDNIKITWPDDFVRGEKMIARSSKMDIRLGNGYDVHAFSQGDKVILCGIEVPHDKALLGHSDADVAMHALTDALYGALAQGDIGRHFPPSDPQWKGASSDIFLRHAGNLAREMGFAISNVDVTIVCERPKIGPHATVMMARLADILAIEVSRVSVKATTSERLGFTGREEGIASIATATLIKGA
ncbi:bifunctional 2-C-methyl-D-erythritol 4-phosphate cytidylyltransferase/2-C-methyl-D-erythritol 2,4-cyclodiphosphate synthase [Albirhodobacter sp. R86504]|uniref:bifunctional 2-C-methyl-D-erythritol 4-phosphate cytidylyltransferase/2-C-methyl-D-erythritol 2,4-cyclodiphosphate synthase n=1 Tax=Albirhodobacter sp. R86504 TaxID=3093848 RepID=UPI00366B30ED